MKATGIVRRIDDLGRVVIPKEIRRTLRIREGDPLEIFTSNDGEVIFKKYSPIGELSVTVTMWSLPPVSRKRSCWSDEFPLLSSSCATSERAISFPRRSIRCIRWKA